MNINISIEYLFLDVVGPVTPQSVQLTRGIQFVCKALVITNIVMPLKEITLVSKRIRQKIKKKHVSTIFLKMIILCNCQYVMYCVL